MSRAYKFRDQSKPHFVTLPVMFWIDLFTRKEYCYLFLESVQFCQAKKGLIVHAWVIMPSHVHMIIGSKEKPMQDILRDLKSFTSREIKEWITEHPKESRKDWLLQMFKQAGRKNKNNREWQLWQQHNHPIELWDNYMMEQKLDYLHDNPVKAEIVAEPHDYTWSSAGDYAGMKGPIDVELIQ